MSRKPKDSNVVDLAAVRLEKKAADMLDPIRKALRAMPIDQRAETIIGMFAIITAEFAAMVLENVEPPPKPPRRKR